MTPCMGPFHSDMGTRAPPPAPAPSSLGPGTPLTFFPSFLAVAAAATVPAAGEALVVSGLGLGLARASGSAAAMHVSRAPVEAWPVQAAAPKEPAPAPGLPFEFEAPSMRVSHSLMVPSDEQVARASGTLPLPARPAAQGRDTSSRQGGVVGGKQTARCACVDARQGAWRRGRNGPRVGLAYAPGRQDQHSRQGLPRRCTPERCPPACRSGWGEVTYTHTRTPPGQLTHGRPHPRQGAQSKGHPPTVAQARERADAAAVRALDRAGLAARTHVPQPHAAVLQARHDDVVVLLRQAQHAARRRVRGDDVALTQRAAGGAVGRHGMGCCPLRGRQGEAGGRGAGQGKRGGKDGWVGSGQGRAGQGRVGGWVGRQTARWAMRVTYPHRVCGGGGAPEGAETG